MNESKYTYYTSKYILKGHTQEVHSISFSPCGKFLASGSNDKAVKIWMVETKKCLHTFKKYQGHLREISCVSFSPRGDLVASCSKDTIKIWDFYNEKCIHTLFEDGSVLSVAFSPDGKFLASGSWNKKIKIWDIHTVKSIIVFNGTENNFHAVNSLSFSPCGRFLASASWDVKIWDLYSKNCICTMLGHTDSIRSVSFSPCGKFVASGSRDMNAKIWEIETEKCVYTLQGHSDAVTSVSYSSCGRFIATGSSNIKIWEPSTGKCITTIVQDFFTYSLSFSPCNRFLAVGSEDKIIQLIDVYFIPVIKFYRILIYLKYFLTSTLCDPILLNNIRHFL